MMVEEKTINSDSTRGWPSENWTTVWGACQRHQEEETPLSQRLQVENALLKGKWMTIDEQGCLVHAKRVDNHLPLLCKSRSHRCLWWTPRRRHWQQNGQHWGVGKFSVVLVLTNFDGELITLLMVGISQVSGLIAGVMFGLLSGQPLTILGLTGPDLVFESLVSLSSSLPLLAFKLNYSFLYKPKK